VGVVRDERMDTRTKIVPPAEAARLAAAGATVVSGYFDPLVAWHVDRLHELKQSGGVLLVLIAQPENPILPARARAELVAGLRGVDYVCESRDGIAAGVQLEKEHTHGLQDLIERVHSRARAGQAV